MSNGFCPYCGRQHAPGSVFCPETGQKLAPQPPAHGAQGGYAQTPAYPQPQGYGPPQPAGYAQQPAMGPSPHGQYAPYPQAVAYPQPNAMAHLPGAAPRANVRHSYPLAIRDAGFGTAVGLMVKTLPYALARFGILLTVSIATVIWYCVAFGGWALLGSKIHPFVGFAWFVAACGVYGYLWWLIVRYFLYLLKCGHIAVLTELITHGRIGNGSQGMFAYGKQVVQSRFAEVTVLFVIDRLVSGVVRAFNRTLDFVAGLLPIPGLSSIMSFVNAVIYAATTYLDETIFSYGLARRESNPWASAKDGLIYYAQNSKEILKTGVFVVILDKVLTVVVWIAMLAPAFALSWMMPRSIVGVGSLFAFGFAALIAGNVRAAFLKPIFLIMVMTKFHVQVQNQPIDQEWDERLTRASNKFREIDEKVRSYRPAPVPAPAV
jgi:hypothetical protein